MEQDIWSDAEEEQDLGLGEELDTELDTEQDRGLGKELDTEQDRGLGKELDTEQDPGLSEVLDLGLGEDDPGLGGDEWQDDPCENEQDSTAAGGSKTMDKQPVAAGGSKPFWVKLEGILLQTFRTVVSKYTDVLGSALEEAVTQAYSEMQTQHPEIVWTRKQFRYRYLLEKKRTARPKRRHKWTREQIEWLAQEYRHWPADFVATHFYDKFKIRVGEAAVRSAFNRYCMPKKDCPATHRWTHEEIEWLKLHFQEGSPDEVTFHFNHEFTTSVSVGALRMAWNTYCLHSNKCKLPSKKTYDGTDFSPDTGNARPAP
jgi:hypothetical protein